MPSRNVLIVDDEHDTNDILAGLVRSHGFMPVQLYRGSDVLAAVERYRPAVILLALMLPDTYGFAVCEQLKKDRDELV